MPLTSELQQPTERITHDDVMTGEADHDLDMQAAQRVEPILRGSAARTRAFARRLDDLCCVDKIAEDRAQRLRGE
ncbi:MAG: hypothetical protein R2710_09335 [Acidimicrobiales bacterium]